VRLRRGTTAGFLFSAHLARSQRAKCAKNESMNATHDRVA
jgi:hypothetical protein